MLYFVDTKNNNKNKDERERVRERASKKALAQ
jgi:hypothetical protein